MQRTAMATFLLLSFVTACGEPTGAATPTAPSAEPTGAPPPKPTPAPIPSDPPTASASSSATPPPSASAPAEAGRCKSSADCQPDEDCILGLPLNGKCWKKGTPHPVCLAAGTTIDTPSGPRPVEDLRAGDLVWTLDHGLRVAAPILETGHATAPPDHVVRTISLEDGRAVTASPGHPTCGDSARPRAVAQIEEGTVFDGSRVADVRVSPYGGKQTFDLLPASDSGCYWAGGVLLGSTLR